MTEQEKETKAKNLGASFKIEIENGEENIVGYLKKPSRILYSAVMKLLQDDVIKANETLLRSCLITEVSDMRLIDDDDVFMSVLPQLSNIIELKKSKLTTL
jgi:hypothetical protein